MKINFSDYNFKGFLRREVEFCGQDATLVLPESIKTEFTEKTAIFRSSIWSKDGELLSAGMKKFTNWLENTEHFPDPTTINDTDIRLKLDGCLDGETVVETEHGKRTIKQVCEDKDSKVLAFVDGEQKFVDIQGYSIKSPSNNWYELELEDGKIVKLTGNHMVYLPELNCYRRVDELNGDEEVLLKK